MDLGSLAFVVMVLDRVNLEPKAELHDQRSTKGSLIRGAEPAVLRIHQGSDAKAAAWSDHFDAIITPTQLNLSRNNTVELVSDVALPEDHISLTNAAGSSLAGQGCEGRQLKISAGFHGDT
jgi:hypothetical protein